MNNALNMRKGFLLTSYLSIILGFVLLFFPATTLKTICFAFGVILMVYGIVHAFNYFSKELLSNYYNYDLAMGLISIVLSIVIFVKSELIISILPVLLGLSVIINGIIKFQHSLDLRRLNYARWWWVLIMCSISLILGIILLLNPFQAMETLIMVVGASLIYNGFTDVITTICLSRRIKQAVAK